MLIREGKTGNIFWIEFSTEKNLMIDFIAKFSAFLLGETLAIISFDGDSFVPTAEEYKRGWKFNNEIAYFENLNSEELLGDIFDIYDQWFILNYNRKEVSSNEIFVTFSGFSIDNNISTKLIKNMSTQFWETISREEIKKFVLNGDNFSYGSINKKEIEEIKRAFELI
jgi:hypothetical protein